VTGEEAVAAAPRAEDAVAEDPREDAPASPMQAKGDTRLLITDLLGEGLGYDKYADLTTEYMVRQDFADYRVSSSRRPCWTSSGAR
jgi:hypothetical protein